MKHKRNNIRVLITNDDGIFAEGLLPLAEELSRVSCVNIVVPDRERSAVSHSLTLFSPVRMRKIKVNGFEIFIVSGTPADCVRLGVVEIDRRKTDIVISGINYGANLGQDVIYSGTVAAAREAVFLGKTGIAISSVGKNNFKEIAKKSAKIIQKVFYNNFKGLLNINFPTKKSKGIKITKLGQRKYQDIISKQKDPFGVPYYWLKSELVESLPLDKESDVDAIRKNFISITPLTYELTDFFKIESLRNIFK